jgi:hypothetical protein
MSYSRPGDVALSIGRLVHEMKRAIPRIQVELKPIDARLYLGTNLRLVPL